MITRRLPRSTLFPYTTLFRSDGQRERSSITPSRRVALVSGAQPMGGGASPSTGGRAGGAHPGPDRTGVLTSLRDVLGGTVDADVEVVVVRQGPARLVQELLGAPQH